MTSSRLIRGIITWGACVTAVMHALPAHADSSTLTGAVEQAFSTQDQRGIMALRSRGGAFERIDNVEFLPGGSAMLEVTVRLAGQEVRVPMKAGRTTAPECKTWRVTWTPHKDYMLALANLLSSEALIEVDAPAWTASSRIASMPVILTRKRVITPYRAIELDAPGPSAPMGALTPPRELSEDVQRWLTESMEGEPGAASVDIVADRRVTWLGAQRVLVASSMQGAFKAHFVTRKPDGSFGVIETAAPIFGSLPEVKRPVPLVLGFYPQDDTFGWRVSYGAAVMAPEPTSCADDMTFCYSDPSAYVERLKALAASMRAKNPDAARHVMFATTGEVTLAEAIPWLSVSPAAFGLGFDKVFIGLIQR